jgi:hypothetical protein
MAEAHEKSDKPKINMAEGMRRLLILLSAVYWIAGVSVVASEYQYTARFFTDEEVFGTVSPTIADSARKQRALKAAGGMLLVWLAAYAAIAGVTGGYVWVSRGFRQG